MAKRRRASRRFSRRRRGVSKGKPSLAVLAGLAVGPAAVALGTGSYPGPIWQVDPSLMGQEALDRTTIAYAGYKVSDGSHFSIQQGGYIGTVAAVVGILAHKAASMSGINATLARSKMPFRI